MVRTEYTLHEILTGKNIQQFVVPEIQRDYVWDLDRCQALVDQLVDAYQDFAVLPAVTLVGEDATPALRNKVLAFCLRQRPGYGLGFLYAYQDPSFPNQSFLIDGQQRLTSLFLLLLAAAVQENRTAEFRRCYLTREGLPRLEYRVRSSAQEFLSRLVTLLAPAIEANSPPFAGTDFQELVKRQYWYFQRYEQDTTIGNLLNNFVGMAAVLKERLSAHPLENESLGFSFYDYLHECVRFWYFDVSHSAQGEELYLSLNANGEPLVGSDDLKVRLLAGLPMDERAAAGEAFEEWENYFWLHRAAITHDAGRGFSEFFRWVAVLWTVVNRTPEATTRRPIATTEQLLSASTEASAKLVATVPFTLAFAGQVFRALENLFALMGPAPLLAAEAPVISFDQDIALRQWNWGTAASMLEPEWLHPAKPLKAREALRLLPALAYLLRREELHFQCIEMEVYRLVRYFRNLSRYSEACIEGIKVAFALADTPSGALDMALPEWGSGSSNSPAVPAEEWLKIRLYQTPSPDAARAELERLCWELEDCQWNDGRIFHLIGDILKNPSQGSAAQSLRVTHERYLALDLGTRSSRHLLQSVLLLYANYGEDINWAYISQHYNYGNWSKIVRNQNVFGAFFDRFKEGQLSVADLYDVLQREYVNQQQWTVAKVRSITSLYGQLIVWSLLFDWFRKNGSLEPNEATLWNEGLADRKVIGFFKPGWEGGRDRTPTKIQQIFGDGTISLWNANERLSEANRKRETLPSLLHELYGKHIASSDENGGVGYEDFVTNCLLDVGIVASLQPSPSLQDDDAT